VAKMAKAIGMNVVVTDPVFKTSEEAPFPVLSFDELLSKSDFISIHAPFMESTKYKFDLSAFKKMKKGALLVNAARGGIVKEADLLVALKEGILGGAALDVFEKEPFNAADPVTAELLKNERFVATPHVGAQTQESQKAVGLETADKILALSLALQSAKSAPKALNFPPRPRWTLSF
jgi:phosphoglycerate dehydrogenase-like enzyme